MNGKDSEISDLSDTLAKAALFGNKEILEDLLDNGADPNIPNSKGDCPLHVAARYGETECASLLLAHKAAVNARGHAGHTPLHMAVSGVCMQVPGERHSSENVIRENQMNIVRLLVSHGADLNALDDNGSTPKDLAMDSDFFDGVDLIDELMEIKAKHDQDLLFSRRRKEIFSSCESGDLETVKSLLPFVRQTLNEFLASNKDNLLMCAARHGHLPIVEYCLDEGAVAVANPSFNKTALHMACEAGHTDVVVVLLNRLPALLMIDDSPGETSLHIACRGGQVEIVRNLLLVAEQTDVLKSPDCVVQEEGAPPEYLYDHSNNKHVMNEALPEIEIDVMAMTSFDRRTPLHDAAISGNPDVMRLLVGFLRSSPILGRRNSSARGSGRGSSSSSRGKGSTPHQSNLDGFGYGANKSGKQIEQIQGIDLSTIKGRTAFHEASRHCHYEVMEILLQAGADINAFMNIDLDPSANTDLTALVQACLMSQPETVRFLLRHGAKDARLKALSRSLKASLHTIAGILLCYNNQVKEVSVDIRRALSLSSDASKTFLNVLWNSKNLKYIHKDWLENVVHELPHLQDRMCAISQIDISSNQIEELPIEIFKLPYLTNLDVSRNRIKRLPHEGDKFNGGWKCSKLSSIDAVDNEITSLPPCLFHLEELREINMCSNKITAVPGSVWSAPKLTRLYLARNLIEVFPESDDSSTWTESESPSHVYSLSPTSPSHSGVSDSGYRSDAHILPQQLDSLNMENMSTGSPLSGGGVGCSVGRERRSSTFKFAYGPLNVLSNVSIIDRRTQGIHMQAVIGRRFETFHDINTEVEDLDALDEVRLGDEEGRAFMLEVLDLSSNKLTSIPANLSCLSPKLTKLNLSKNRIKYLGNINNYPLDLEFLDASSNNLHTAIAPPLSMADMRYQPPCIRKQMNSSPNHGGGGGGGGGAGGGENSTFSESLVSITPTTSPGFFKLCSHRAHKNLRKLSTLKLNHNHLMDLQLFRSVNKVKGGGSSDLAASFEETSKPRSSTTSDPYAIVATVPPPQQKVDSLSKSLFTRTSSITSSSRKALSDISIAAHHDTGKSSGSSLSSGSQNGSGSRGEVGVGGSGGGASSLAVSVVISPLYPTLATLELSHNRLRSVPTNVHHISTLSSLLLNHNKDIDTLPLELSNLEHLWNLEYDGCPLTNPPKEDLDKFRLASDKLLYMRSLLHDAKPNESMKLMLVGYQKMGKTTLLSRLKEVHEKVTPFTTFTQRVTGEEPVKAKKGRSDTLSTVGVDLGIWKYRKDLEGAKKKGTKPMRSVTFYTWDFGGQEEYYVTHQCFLSTRSLYLVVWNVTKGEYGIDQLGPWLHNIQARAPGSPVVIVGTHCDTLKPPEEKDKRKAELNHIIYNKYLVGQGNQILREMGLPKILDVIYVGCPLNGKPEGVSELRNALYDIAFSLAASNKAGTSNSKTKLLEKPIPASFLKLEERVRHLSVDCLNEGSSPVLREQVFREKTSDIIANPRELNQAVTFLHENGIMLHYATPALSHLYFVDPQWLCDMLAHIVTVPEVNRFIPRHDSPEAGILRTTVLAHVFKGNVFPQAHRKEYIELLGKFEVALYLDAHRLLVPSMLPQKPAFTVHRFKNTFPRPSLSSILHRSPETPKLFGHSQLSPMTTAMTSSSRSSFTPNKDRGDGLQLKANMETPTPLAVASYTSDEFYRTGLILRRFYFMTYVPSGFWPRLVSRFLASSEFSGIVLRNLGYSKEQVGEITKELMSGESKSLVDLEWTYWKTGIELWYKGLSLLRLCEITPGGSFQSCKPSSSIFTQSETSPVEPSMDVEDLTFELNGNWVPVEMTPNRGIEIFVPDTVCLAMLHNEIHDRHTSTPSPSNYNGVTSPEPREGGGVEEFPHYESHWMSAELLSISADYIDTLLEDWYPGLGAREGGRTMEAIPYVNRIIPCPYCVNEAIPLEEYLDTLVESEQAGSSAAKKGGLKIKLSRKSKKSLSMSPSSPISPSPSGSSSASSSRAKRALFSDSKGEGDVSSNSASVLKGMEEEEEEERPTMRQGSLLDLQGKLVLPAPKSSHPDQELMLASKFGIMIESCILAARRSEPLVCPAHPNHPLPIKDLAPDLVFADLPAAYILDPALVDKGQYVDHGSFGDIYHGAVYPSIHATDDEGREVAIKIDRLDSKKFSPDTATKAYVEVRAEVSILHRLHHAHVIDFIGVVLHPLCFILEWATGGSLHSVLTKYKKMDGRVSPKALLKTASQVASGLAYLHQQKIVYYDLKSPNILVFQFPSVDASLAATQGQPSSDCPQDSASDVYIKIADLGISQILSPGGVMGFKGSPGFMAPEILKYVGTEACTEKVDIYSFAMFLFETISLHFPFEKQNLMHAQIEKLVIDGERPPLQNRELNNPILYLDIMRWCWQQDFRHRPSARQLEEILTNPSIPYLVDAISLHNSDVITCACVCIRPIEVSPPNELDSNEGSSFFSSMATPHSHLTQGDLQEELWLATYNEKTSAVVVIDFKEKAAQSFPVCESKITTMCGVSYTMWLGTEDGQILILDVISKQILFRRYLSVHSDQGIVGLYHLLSIRRVVIARRDGYIILCNEDIENHKSSDTSQFDNRQNSTALPIRSVSRFPEKLPIICSTLVSVTLSGHTKWSLWCGTNNEMIIALDINNGYISNCQKLYNRSRYEVNQEDHVASIVTTESCSAGVSKTNVWAFTRPANVLYCWDTVKEIILNKIDMNKHAPEPISFFSVVGTYLLFAVQSGKVFRLETAGSDVTSSVELRGHAKGVYKIMSLGARVLPRHWLPSIIGRSNVIEYYKDLVDEDEIKAITSSMVGRQSRLVVTIGCGYQGVAGRQIEPLMSPRDSEENFVLLWFLDT